MCVLFHKWGKWDHFVEKWLTIYNGKTINYERIRQHRRCVRCEKSQFEYLD
jgi:hypothetical protein